MKPLITAISADITISGQGTDCDVGFGDQDEGSLRIYPNPAGELLYVDGLPDNTVQIEVTDITGRICMSQMCNGPQAELDLSGLDAGIYYLRISGRDAVVIRPFIRE